MRTGIGMPLLEDIKKTAERVTGWGRPSPSEITRALRQRKPHTFRFEDDGIIPNNPFLPLVLYRSPLHFAAGVDPAAMFEDLFERNGWGDSWRNGVYDYVHYHSRIHEVLGIARGSGLVRFGGSNGRKIRLKAGDVAILPAGTGHECLEASRDFLVVGAYPPFGTYDECRTSERERKRALVTIPKVARPRKDPVYGSDGPLLRLWRPRRDN
jgi:uncharacterized protein YjlB